MAVTSMILMSPPPMPTQAASPTPAECTCGAKAFYENQVAGSRGTNTTNDDHRRWLRKVAPMEHDSTSSSTPTELVNATKLPNEPQLNEDEPVRKRSLWRKLTGKGPKCICARLERERLARPLGKIDLPEEYKGCVRIRVAGKRVPYSHAMVKWQRKQYKPMERIVEESQS